MSSPSRRSHVYPCNYWGSCDYITYKQTNTEVVEIYRYPVYPIYSSPLPYNNTTRNLKQKGNMGLSETGNRITPPLPSLYLMCTTFSNGCHGSHNDEERSEMRYVMRIAGPRESSKFWTHIVLPGYAWLHARLSVLVPHSTVMLYIACQNMILPWVNHGSIEVFWVYAFMARNKTHTPPLVSVFFLLLV